MRGIVFIEPSPVTSRSDIIRLLGAVEVVLAALFRIRQHLKWCISLKQCMIAFSFLEACKFSKITMHTGQVTYRICVANSLECLARSGSLILVRMELQRQLSVRFLQFCLGGVL